MVAVAENLRVNELQRLGASQALVRLSSGDCVHRVFQDRCLGPPYYVYHLARTPDGPQLVPLWDYNDTAVGVWQRPDGLEFIEFSIEAHEEYSPLARTEQGFWATQFDFFYESDVPLEELREAAKAVGFRFLDRFLASREQAEARMRLFEDHAAWLRELVAGIDREATEA